VCNSDLQGVVQYIRSSVQNLSVVTLHHVTLKGYEDTRDNGTPHVLNFGSPMNASDQLGVPATLSPKKEPFLYRRLGGPQNMFGHFD
jgi:hypothetical protein